MANNNAMVTNAPIRTVAFRPIVGMPSVRQLDTATDAFWRADANKDAPPMLVATRVPVRRWLAFDGCAGVKVECRVCRDAVSVASDDVDTLIATDGDGSVGAEATDETALVDVYVVSWFDGARGSILNYVCSLIDEFDVSKVLCGLPKIDFRVPNGIVQPDFFAGPMPWARQEKRQQPRLIIEWQTDNRSFIAAHERCKGYFNVFPTVRVVVLIKLFRRRGDDGTNQFAGLAVQYGRCTRDNAGGTVDAVSFGTAATEAEHIALLNNDEKTFPGVRVRVLPVAPNAAVLNDVNPWLGGPNASATAAGAELSALRRAVSQCKSTARSAKMVLQIEKSLKYARDDGEDQQEFDLERKCEATLFRKSAKYAVEAMAEAAASIGDHLQQPAGPYLLLRAADIFEGACLPDGTPYQPPQWQKFCFVDLWKVLQSAVTNDY